MAVQASTKAKHRHFPKPTKLPAGQPVFAVAPAGMRRYRWAVWTTAATRDNYREEVSPQAAGFASTEEAACIAALSASPRATRISNYFATPSSLSRERWPGHYEIEGAVRDAHWAATGADARATALRWGISQEAVKEAMDLNFSRRETMSALDWFEQFKFAHERVQWRSNPEFQQLQKRMRQNLTKPKPLDYDDYHRRSAEDDAEHVVPDADPSNVVDLLDWLERSTAKLEARLEAERRES